MTDFGLSVLVGVWGLQIVQLCFVCRDAFCVAPSEHRINKRFDAIDERLLQPGRWVPNTSPISPVAPLLSMVSDGL